jgi:tRNA dimethylallyltransferase
MSSSVDSDGAELRIICGPTAAGKSALAMSLAVRHGLTILSADSRQIYRGFDIGTAKPSAADRALVPHLGLDVADPAERWSAARFANDAVAWIANTGVARTLVVGADRAARRGAGARGRRPREARRRALAVGDRRAAPLGAHARPSARAPGPHAAAARR